MNAVRVHEQTGDWCRENDIAVSTFYNWAPSALSENSSGLYSERRIMVILRFHVPENMDVVPIDIVPAFTFRNNIAHRRC